MARKQFQFEWDEGKAATNVLKHGVTFELASTIFGDPRLFTIADLAHSEREERWFSIGCAQSGALLSVVYLWIDLGPDVAKVTLISARKATRTEIRYYQVGTHE